MRFVQIFTLILLLPCTIAQVCNIRQANDHSGGNHVNGSACCALSINTIPAADEGECCYRCYHSPTCTTWVFEITSGECFLTDATNDGFFEEVDHIAGKIERAAGCARPAGWCEAVTQAYDFYDCDGDYNPEHVCQDLLDPTQFGTIQNDTISCIDTFPTAPQSECANAYDKCRRPTLGFNQMFESCRDYALIGEECYVKCLPGYYGSFMNEPVVLVLRACGAGSNGIGQYQGNEFRDMLACDKVQCASGFEPVVPADSLFHCEACPNGTFAGGTYGPTFCENITVCERPVGWCSQPGLRYDTMDCDEDGVMDHVCQDVSNPPYSFLQFGIIRSQGQCNDTFPTDPPPDAPYFCQNGCQIVRDYINDNYCDCSKCEDELFWNCSSCGSGCPSICGASAYCGYNPDSSGVQTPPQLRSACDVLFWYCPRPSLSKGYVFLDCPELAMVREPCTAGCAPGYIYQPYQSQAGIYGDRNFTLRCGYDAEGAPRNSFAYELGGAFADCFSCKKVQCLAGFEPRTPVAYNDTDCVACPQGKFAGGTYGSAFCENLTVCERPVGWCSQPGLRYDTMDCDEDGVMDHVCQNVSNPTAFLQFGIIRSQHQCRDTFPNDTPPGAPYFCQTGCEISKNRVDNNWCDCPNCEDELLWNCSDCAAACPINGYCGGPGSCGANRYPEVGVEPPQLRSACDVLFWKCPRPSLREGYAFLDCPELALRGEPCTAGCAPGFVYGPGLTRRVMASTYGDRSFTLSCGHDVEGVPRDSFAYELDGAFADWFSCIKVYCPAGFEPRTPVAYDDSDCVACPQGKFAGGTYGSAFCENLTVCERPVGWCSQPGLRYDTMDCDEDGVMDHVCQNVSKPNASFLQFGIIRSQDQCRDTFPNDTPPGAPYFCQTGCEISSVQVGDNLCDCSNCEDELLWNCSDCAAGCPTNEYCSYSPGYCGASRYGGVETPQQLRSACDFLFWKCPRPSLREGYVFLDCPELALRGEPCTAGCAPGYVFLPSVLTRRVMADIYGDRNFTLRCGYDAEGAPRDSFAYELDGAFADWFSCNKVQCLAGFEPRTPVAYNDTDCVACPQGKFAGGTYGSAFCENLTVCERPVGWCSQPGLQYDTMDCDEDGMMDHVCQNVSNPTASFLQFGIIRSQDQCKDTFPYDTPPGAPYFCQNGCFISKNRVDNNWCDCPNCEDELLWNCSDCAAGCPTSGYCEEWGGPGYCGASRYPEVGVEPPQLRSDCDVLFWKCPRPSLDEGYVFLDCPEFAAEEEPCTAGCAPGYVYQPYLTRRVMAGIEGDRNFTLRCRYNIEGFLESFSYEYSGLFKYWFSCIKVYCPAGFEPRTPVAYYDTDCVACPQGKFAGGAFASASLFCENLTVCERPAGWCEEAALQYSSLDCDGDGSLDHVCQNISYPPQFGTILTYASFSCADTWPNADRSECDAGYGICSRPDGLMGPMMEYKNCRQLAAEGELCEVGCDNTGFPLRVMAPQDSYVFESRTDFKACEVGGYPTTSWQLYCVPCSTAMRANGDGVAECGDCLPGYYGPDGLTATNDVNSILPNSCYACPTPQAGEYALQCGPGPFDTGAIRSCSDAHRAVGTTNGTCGNCKSGYVGPTGAQAGTLVSAIEACRATGFGNWTWYNKCPAVEYCNTTTDSCTFYTYVSAWESFGSVYGPYVQVVPPPPLLYNPKDNELYVKVVEGTMLTLPVGVSRVMYTFGTPAGHVLRCQSLVQVNGPCARNTFNATGSSPCAICPNGRWANNSGSTTCDLCVPGSTVSTCNTRGCLDRLAVNYNPSATLSLPSSCVYSAILTTQATAGQVLVRTGASPLGQFNVSYRTARQPVLSQTTLKFSFIPISPEQAVLHFGYETIDGNIPRRRLQQKGITFLQPELLEPSAAFTISPGNLTLLEPLRVCAAVPSLNVSTTSFIRLFSSANFSNTTGQNISNMREYLPTDRYPNNGTVCANIQLPGTYLLVNASYPPKDCQVSNWTNLTACSRTCGGGTYSRFREIAQPPSSDGVQCPVLLQEVACNVAPCPIDCVLSSQFSEWSTCSAQCLGGSATTSIQQRTRSVLIPASGGGLPCNQTIETRTCQVPSCDGDTLVIVVAQLDDSGSRLTVSFSQPVAPAASELPLGTSFACSRLLTFNTLSLLNASKCRWLGSVNTSSLQITLGAAAQATLQDTLSFLPVLTSLGKSPIPLFPITFKISPPSDLSSVAPIAQITGAGVVPVCSSVVLDNYASRRSAGRSWVKVEWRLLTFSASSSAVLGNGSVFRMSATNLQSDRSYIFELTVENWLGLSGSSNFTIKTIASPVPRVTLPTFLNMQVDNQLQLIPTLEWDGGCGPAEELFYFEWSYESEDTALTLMSQSRVAISLVLPRRALVEGVPYIFTLTVTSIYDAQAQTSASAYVVATSPTPVTAVMAGGSLDLPVGLSDFYSLDASGSYDERDSEFASGLPARRRRRSLLNTAFPNRWYFSWSCYERAAVPQTTSATTVTKEIITKGTATFNTTTTITKVALTIRTGFDNLGSQTWPPNSATVCATEIDNLLSAANTTNSVLRLPLASLDVAKHYFFQVEVTRFNVSDLFEVEIRPRKVSAFNTGAGIERVGIAVSQVSDVQWRDAWPSGQALALTGVLTLWNKTDTAMTSANVTPAAVNDTTYQYIWRELNGKLNLRDRNIVSTPSNSLSLIILPDILEPLETYLFAFSVVPASVDVATFLLDPASVRDALTATLAITVADAPLPGFCYITPEVGEAFLTNFVLQCEQWSAQDATPLFYRFQQLLPTLRLSQASKRTDTGERYLLSDWRDIPYTAPRRLFPLQADPWNRPVPRTTYTRSDGSVVNVTEVTIMASVRTFRGSLAELPVTVYLKDPTDPYAVLTSLLNEWDKFNFHRDINGLTENALIMAQGLLPLLQDDQLAARGLPSRAQLLLLLFGEVEIMSSLLPSDLEATLDRLAQMVTVITALPSELVPSLRESVVSIALSFLNAAATDASREIVSSVSDWVFTILSQLQVAGFQNMTEAESDRFLSFLRSLGADLTKMYSLFQSLDETVVRTSGNTTLTSAKQDSADSGKVTSSSGAVLEIPKLDQGNVVMSILDQPDSLSKLATRTPSANLVINRSSNVFQMNIVDENGNKINLASVTEPIRIVIPHQDFEFGCSERSCDLWGNIQNAAQAGVSTVDYLWLTAGCEYNVDESTLNTTVCYCNPKSLQGGTLEVGKPPDETGVRQPGNVVASVMNYLSTNYRQFRPRINNVDVTVWADLTPQNLRENPVGLGLLCSILAIYLLLLAWAIWNTKRQRRHLTQSRIRKTRELWVKNYMDTQRKRGCWNFMHQWWVVLIDKHLWLCAVVHKYGESFDQVARVNVLLMTVLLQMTVAALFYGIQTFLGSITVSIISVIVAGGLSELTRATFKKAGPALPHDQFKYQIRVKRAEFLGLPAPKPPKRLHKRWRTVVYTMVFLVCLTCLGLILVYSLQFDLTYHSQFVWKSQEGAKLSGTLVGETCDKLADCQQNCTAMAGECTGIQIREKDQRCSLIKVQGDATVLSGYRSDALTYLYGNSMKWLQACLIAFFIDAFISRPISALFKAMYVYFVVIKIPHLNIEGITLKGFKSDGNLMMSEAVLTQTSMRPRPKAAELSAFPSNTLGVPGEDHSVPMSLQFRNSPPKKRAGSGGSLPDEDQADGDSELSQLVAVEECAHCGALSPADKEGVDEEAGEAGRDRNPSLVSGSTDDNTAEMAEIGPAAADPAQDGHRHRHSSDSSHGSHVSVEEDEANQRLLQLGLQMLPLAKPRSSV